MQKQLMADQHTTHIESSAVDGQNRESHHFAVFVTTGST
jgi:hypothetical protein